ncbi:MAG: mechanosensitive ion channel family protein, partial [Chloroflexi bacterium]|nr:mechanosensitive ion channel family protein [Chloroflexota bacterium]
METIIPEIDFVVDGSAIATSLLRVLLITLASFLGYIAVTRATRKAIEARIPLIKEENRQRLSARATTITSALSQVIKVAVVILALLAILAEVGVQIAPMLAAVGVVGLALGFAAQGIVRDYIHGIFILIEDWYRVGDWIKIDSDEGEVEEISLRRTVLRNMDGTLMIRPNSSVVTASNMTRDLARLNMTVSVAYGTNIEKAFAAINRVGLEFKADELWSTNLLTAPAALRISDLGESGIDILIRADTKPGTQWGISGEFRKRLLAQFELDGIEIPFQHMKIYFGNPQDTPRSLPEAPTPPPTSP